MLHLARASVHGFAGASILMTLATQPSADPTTQPHPVGTPCERPSAMPAGPTEVSVHPSTISLADASGGSNVSDERDLVFSLYSGDFRQSAYSVSRAAGAGEAAPGELPGPLRAQLMILSLVDLLIMTLGG